MGKKENDALREKEKTLARKYIESELPDEETLEELNRLCRPMYLYLYNGYHLKIPQLGVDDYLAIGYVTLWKVLERCRKNPDIINNFSAYLFTSVSHSYATEFRKYVFKNPVVIRDYEYRQAGYDYNLANAVYLTKYIERVIEHRRQWEREYWSKHKDKKAEKDKRYYLKHREEISEKSKQYREKNKDEIREKKRKYAQEHKEKINAYHRRKWHEDPERFRKYHREYLRKYRQEHLEHCRERDREWKRKERLEHPELVRERKKRYYEKHKDEINARRRARYKTEKEKEKRKEET